MSREKLCFIVAHLKVQKVRCFLTTSDLWSAFVKNNKDFVLIHSVLEEYCSFQGANFVNGVMEVSATKIHLCKLVQQQKTYGMVWPLSLYAQHVDGRGKNSCLQEGKCMECSLSFYLPVSGSYLVSSYLIQWLGWGEGRFSRVGKKSLPFCRHQFCGYK